MRLLPREQDRLLLFLAAELARRRRGRGLRLNQAEAVALIADEVCEAARDGRSYAEAEAAGYALLDPADVADGVAELVRRVEVEALFADGSRLLVLHDPIGSPAPPPQREAEIEWLARDRAVTVVNEGAVPVGVTSHFHFFEVNRALRFERVQAFGMRLNIPAGTAVRFEPGDDKRVTLVELAGDRRVFGLNALTQGGSRDAALGRLAQWER
jgi:urease subunit gamma/beta